MEPPKYGDYIVTYDIKGDWGNGAIVMVTIKNNTSEPIKNWTLTWSFPDNQKINDLWQAQLEQKGNSVKVTGSSILGTGEIPAKGEVSFGFNMGYSGRNRTPDDFELNGVKCKVN
ncbi:MAG TPA: hypothetical protein DCE02_07745 [Ruminiclostridium sp.]|uniref:CBM2 domain-containing protein n=1 Tax=Acetivibrio saccincola TaxID=1677857 RepID=A0A2S8RB38_9FIRM|nr:cellulose binding domain-containing protein [Acetivibrio saccincola]HAA43871.1 hypothetical protein [Ruminiclostridium sp.]NLW26239.1 hypothetical protein [Acetivibrio saccincola]PQQ67013.1 hypothetical protein B9R14_09865 [Acetivibrio saccincola]HOA97496.1 cellulose binding domain-containing protein [Acetivibrio saccincola]HQD27983.1 cellulose binding domain-containing protein [Acetivibrio saccincola]